MAYLALYRAFRPETLDEVVRQEHIIKILRNQIEKNRVGHAYLFCGPRGTGKTSIAKIFARAVNCEHPVNGSPCGACPSCKALAAGNSLDVVEIDAASNNGVDEMRDLREKVQYPPVNGRYKVYIVDEVHMLSAGAFNALLKTLEEPPKHAVFILATTEAQKIPATILSRCMRFDFKLIPQEDLEEHLKKILQKLGKPYEEEAVAAIARAGAGSVRDMLSVADVCVSYESGKLTYASVNAVLGSADFSVMADLCSAVLGGDMPRALFLTEKALSEGKGVGVLTRDILQFLNHCAVAKMCRGAEKILAFPAEMFQKIKAAAEIADGHRLLRATEIFAEAETRLKYSSSARIVLETAVVKASMPETDRDIESLFARVSALEAAVRSGHEAAVPAASVVSAASFAPSAPANTENGVRKEEKKSASAAFSSWDEEELPPPPEEPIFDVGFTDAPFPPSDSVASAGSSGGRTGHVASVGRTKAPVASAFKEKTGNSVPVSGTVTGTVAPPPSVSASSSATASESGSPSATVAASAQTASVPPADKSKAFGMFLRSLRKNCRNGVLFTMCSELDSAFEGETMVLTTTSETIFRSLERPEHREAVSQALQAIGIGSFDFRLRGKTGDGFAEKLEKLKADFADTPIEVK